MKLELTVKVAISALLLAGCGQSDKGQLPVGDIRGPVETVQHEVSQDAAGDNDAEQCHAQCSGKECGNDGCGGECGQCDLGFSCSGGDCVQVACEGAAVSLAGEFSNSISPIVFDSVAVEVLHKRDVDEWEDGCISAVTMVLKSGTGCTLTIEAGEHFNLDGFLHIENLTFEADSQCPGFPDDVEGLYADLTGMVTAGLELGVTDVPGYDVPKSCLNTTFEVHLEGILSEGGGGKELQVLPTLLVVDGDFLSTGEYPLTCPCQPSCVDRECGDAGCGLSCGGCACGEACINGTCAFNACEGKDCGSDGCSGDCGTCTEFSGSFCGAGQQCQCEAECDGKECDDDGCGGECGSCECGESCVQGACELGACLGKECGDDGCGGSCGTCIGGQQGCVAGKCQCVPNCEGKACGPDGCGGKCGICDTYCISGPYECCEADCTNKACGDDGCGGECGVCDCGEKCLAGTCENWTCEGMNCGDDWCGGTCGVCTGCGNGCVEGTCMFVGCSGKDCGSDGCGGNCGVCEGGFQCAAGTCLDIGMAWVSIPAGSFLMGCSPGEEACKANEKPPHNVLVSAFEMLETEVTESQFEAVVGGNPSCDFGAGGGPDSPVECVTVTDALAFCNAFEARLPTEAEWEYAARAGAVSTYACGPEIVCLDDVAWHSTNSGSHKHDVAMKTPNSFGLYDMQGNVWEWTQDCWHATYDGAPQVGFPAWSNDCDEAYSVIRGAGYGHTAKPYFRASFRMAALTFGDYLGFRCVRSK